MSETIKLMLVDDHALFRRGLAGLLADDEAFQVVAQAGSGREALALAVRHCPDVVLLDVHMPGDDGVETARRLKASVPARILMLTVSDKDEDLLGALAAGADGYLLKNAAPEALARAIRQVVSGGGALSPEIMPQVMQAAGRARQERPALSPREREVLQALAEGATTAEIAAALVISKNTVKTHVRRTLRKLDAANRAEAVARALSLGLIRAGQDDG